MWGRHIAPRECCFKLLPDCGEEVLHQALGMRHSFGTGAVDQEVEGLS